MTPPHRQWSFTRPHRLRRHLRVMRYVVIVSAATAITAGSAAPAWAFGAGGTAPGGPLSGSIRPACNGYNMDGTINTGPAADRPGCVDRSAASARRGMERRLRDR